MGDDVCPACGEGRLIDKIEYIGVVESRYSSCTVCFSDVANAEQIRLNKQSMIKHREKMIKSLTNNEDNL